MPYKLQTTVAAILTPIATVLAASTAPAVAARPPITDAPRPTTPIARNIPPPIFFIVLVILELSLLALSIDSAPAQHAMPLKPTGMISPRVIGTAAIPSVARPTYLPKPLVFCQLSPNKPVLPSCVFIVLLFCVLGSL